MARTKKETATTDAKKVQMLTPRVTEKASILTDASVYTFNVPPRTTKGEFKKLFVAQYKENPRKIAVINTPAKNVFRGGKRGVESGSKKMVVYLEKGKTIAFA